MLLVPKAGAEGPAVFPKLGVVVFCAPKVGAEDPNPEGAAVFVPKVEFVEPNAGGGAVGVCFCAPKTGVAVFAVPNPEFPVPVAFPAAPNDGFWVPKTGVALFPKAAEVLAAKLGGGFV